MPTNFQLFGTVHLAILGAVVVLAGVFALIQRRLTPGTRWLRLGLGSLLLLDSLVYYGYLAYRGQLTFPDHLPLELCDASLFLTIFALFTLNRAVYDLAYYWALAGATMALLTPNLWEPFPSFGTIQFFVDHGLIVASVLFLAWSRLMRPRVVGNASDAGSEHPRRLHWRLRLLLQDRLHVPARKAAERFAARFAGPVALVHRSHRVCGAPALRAAISSLPAALVTGCRGLIDLAPLQVENKPEPKLYSG